MTDSPDTSECDSLPDSTKERTRPDFSRFIAIDIETTSLDPADGEIIELGAVWFVDGTETETFRTLVRPESGLPERNRRLTGIDPSHLENAPPAGQALRDFTAFLEDAFIVSHNSSFDIGFLAHHLRRQGLEHIQNPALCTLHLAAIVFPETETLQLGALATSLGIDVRDPHRALQDARMAGRLALRLMREIRRWPPKLVAHLAEYRGKSADPIFDLLDDIAGDARPDPAWRLDKALFRHLEHADAESALPPVIHVGNHEAATIARHDPEVSGEVLAAFERGGVTLLEDTRPGSGPASRSIPPGAGDTPRVVVGIPDESFVPTLVGPDDGMDGAGRPGGSFYLGRRSEYVCLRRAFDEDGRPTGWLELSPFERVVLARWLAGTRIGRIAKVNWWLLNNFSGLKGHLNSLSASAIECMGPLAHHGAPCFAEIAGMRAREAGRVIVDHRHLCTRVDESPGPERLLGPYDRCVVETASRLQSAARASESRDLELDSVRRRLSAFSEYIHGRSSAVSAALTDASLQVGSLFEACRRALVTYREANPRDSGNPVPIDNESWGRDTFSEVRTALNAAADSLARASGLLSSGPDASPDLAVLANFLEDAAETLRLFGNIPPGWAASIEGAPSRNPKRLNLRLMPVDVGAVVGRMIEEAASGVLAADRHIRYQGSFERLCSQWGIPASVTVTERVLGDPAHAMPPVFIPDDLAAPTARAGRRYHWEKYMARTANLLRMVADTLGGRTVAAFSAHHELRRVRELLGEDPPRDCIVLAQYQDGTKSALLREYLGNPATLMLGGRNFLDGVDLRPAGFTVLALVKLPFVSPEDAVHRAALRSLDEQGLEGMKAYLVPLAVETSNRWIDSLIAGPVPEGVDPTAPPGAVIVLDPRALLHDWGDEYVSGLVAGAVHRLSFREMLAQLRELARRSGS